MEERRYIFGFIFTGFFVIIVNLIIGFYNNQSQEYIYSNGKAYSTSFVRAADSKLREYDFTEYENALDDFKNEYEELSVYCEALAIKDGKRGSLYLLNKYDEEQINELFSKYSYTEEQTVQKLEQLEYMITRLKYAVEYKDYISDINNNTEKMSETSLFRGNDRKNIIKAKNNFYGLDDLQISAHSDFGVKQLFSDTVSHMLAVTCAVICGLFYSLYLKSKSVAAAVKNRAWIFALVFSMVMGCIYFTNAYLINSDVGLGDLSRTIQSVSDFITCPTIMSVGTVVIIRIVFIIIACLTIYYCSVGLFLCSRKIIAIPAVFAFVITQILLLNNDVRVHFFSEFSAEKLFAAYKNVYIFGEAVSAAVPLSVLTILLLTVSYIFAHKSISAAVISVGEKAEKAYVDEINQRYNEARLIRHDIKNHLSAVAMLIDEGDTEGARKYLSEISAELDEVKPPVKTGSSVLDALLFRKVADCKAMGIEVCIEFTSDFSELRISNYDLCGIFGNILDNAKEACEKLRSDRKINLIVRTQRDMICIFCENRYTNINENLSTQKPDKSSHGMGLGRVRRIAEKYGGTMEISAENGVFAISILLI